MGGGRGGDAGQRLSLRSSPWSRVCSVQHGRGRMEGLHPGGPDVAQVIHPNFREPQRGAPGGSVGSCG